ncbi:uncharacterized protein LOC133653467 isoform X1 [Entelurus aequoreus]|uniref:uncharacterized protein LOC133653467 isoform X1 n=1 Tax=Entelurus aequoreus TaxID=161455 RepID=UPI002B1D488E|nr:uncharacterized protein LOC133653467 isoform X1 [Entelurus aequoreus]
MSLTAASRLHESNLNLTNRSQKNNWVSFQTKCPPLPSPTLGTHVVLTGNGSHVGSMVSLLCPSKHKRVGVELTCVMAANKARWVGELHCTPLSVFEGNGFRVAALASIVSIGVIFIMSMLFITCCILDCIQKDARRRQQRQVGFEKVGRKYEWLSLVSRVGGVRRKRTASKAWRSTRHGGTSTSQTTCVTTVLPDGAPTAMAARVLSPASAGINVSSPHRIAIGSQDRLLTVTCAHARIMYRSLLENLVSHGSITAVNCESAQQQQHCALTLPVKNILELQSLPQLGCPNFLQQWQLAD